MILDALATALAMPDWRERRMRTAAVIDEAMAALGFAKTTGDPVTREIVRPRDLAPDQRAGLLEIAAHPGIVIARHPVPGRGWAIQQWLGVVPPGPLFRDDVALYDRLRAALLRSEAEALALLLAMPMPLRLEAVADLYLVPHDYANLQVTYLLGSPHAVAPAPDPGVRHVILSAIDGTCGAWADAVARRVLEIEEAPALFADQPTRETSLYPALLLATARAGRIIEPRFERWLGPLLHRWTDRAQLDELIAAIPESRREMAFASALAVPHDLPFLADHILPRYPYASVGRAVLAHLERTVKPKAALRALKELAKSHPSLAAELRAHEARIPVLRVAERQVQPSLEELDERAREQLELAAAIDGERFTAAQVLAGAVADYDPRLIERTKIETTDGEHVLDGWQLSLDSAVWFRAGKSEIVAEAIQGGIQCADPGLRTALAGLSTQRAKKRRR